MTSKAPKRKTAPDEQQHTDSKKRRKTGGGEEEFTYLTDGDDNEGPHTVVCKFEFIYHSAVNLSVLRTIVRLAIHYCNTRSSTLSSLINAAQDFCQSLHGRFDIISAQSWGYQKNDLDDAFQAEIWRCYNARADFWEAFRVVWRDRIAFKEVAVDKDTTKYETRLHMVAVLIPKWVAQMTVLRLHSNQGRRKLAALCGYLSQQQVQQAMEEAAEAAKAGTAKGREVKPDPEPTEEPFVYVGVDPFSPSAGHGVENEPDIKGASPHSNPGHSSTSACTQDCKTQPNVKPLNHTSHHPVSISDIESSDNGPLRTKPQLSGQHSMRTKKIATRPPTKRHRVNTLPSPSPTASTSDTSSGDEPLAQRSKPVVARQATTAPASDDDKPRAQAYARYRRKRVSPPILDGDAGGSDSDRDLPLAQVHTRYPRKKTSKPCVVGGAEQSPFQRAQQQQQQQQALLITNRTTLPVSPAPAPAKDDGVKGMDVNLAPRPPHAPRPALLATGHATPAPTQTSNPTALNVTHVPNTTRETAPADPQPNKDRFSIPLTACDYSPTDIYNALYSDVAPISDEDTDAEVKRLAVRTSRFCFGAVAVAAGAWVVAAWG